jgi:hypothetical protein
LYFCLLGAAWNLALGPCRSLALGQWPAHWSTFEWVGVLAGAAFLALALRETFLMTRIAFDASRLVVRAGALAPWVRFGVPIAEVASFMVREDQDGTFHVVVVTKGGAQRDLPLGLDGVPLRNSWNRKVHFAAPVSHASFVAGRLTDMLEEARRSGHDTYRS